MLKLFLASHGKLASGMKNSTEILLGTSSNLTIFDAYLDDKTVENALDTFYLEVTDEDQVIMLSDLYGGSVNQVMYGYLNKSNTKLISGVNLALLLELSVQQAPLTKKEILTIINQAKQSINLVEIELDAEEPKENFFD